MSAAIHQTGLEFANHIVADGIERTDLVGNFFDE